MNREATPLQRQWSVTGYASRTSTNPNYVPDRTTTENIDLAQRMRAVQAEAFRIANELPVLIEEELEKEIAARKEKKL